MASEEKNTDSLKDNNTSTSTAPPKRKKISLALQGGGSHGAYTWGVVDALLEDERIQIEGVSGTSAGGMNATAIIQGLIKGGNAGARKTMRDYWELIGHIGETSPLQFYPYDKLTKNFTLANNPMLHILQYINTLFSPYQLNPQNIHPMQEIVDNFFDYDALQRSTEHKLFLCATHVETGKLKIFTGKELNPQSLLASACLPTLFQAIEVDGNYYWDGGYIGNPAIYPLIYYCDTPDIVTIQIRRVYSPKLPNTLNDIHNRLAEITFNACLTREMRTISYITKLIDEGTISPGKLKRLFIHMIRDDAFIGSLDHSTALSADPDFLEYLFEAGRRFGRTWLATNFDSIGVRSTAHLEEDYV